MEHLEIINARNALEGLYEIIDDSGFTNNQTGFRICNDLCEIIYNELNNKEKLENFVEEILKKLVYFYLQNLDSNLKKIIEKIQKEIGIYYL